MTILTNPTRKTAIKRVLCIADVPGWIFDRHIHYIRRFLSDEFDIHTAYRGQVYQESEYDLIYPLEFMLVEPESILNPNKYITGIRSFISWAEWDFLSLVNHLSTKFRRVHTVSEELYNIFAPYIPQVSQVTHGVDTELFMPKNQPNDEAGQLRLGWAGNRNTIIKGFWDYIHPLGQLPGIDLKICGFADHNLSLAQMPDFYNEIDAYICASSFEGNNNSLLEAASMERAIITTKVGAVSEYLKDHENALIVERDLNQIIHSVSELRDNPELRLRLGKNARQTLIENKWDWKYKAEDFRRFFRHGLYRKNQDFDRPLLPISVKTNQYQHFSHVLQAQNQILRELQIGNVIQLVDLKDEKRRLETEINALENAIQDIRSSETYRLVQKILSNRLSQSMIQIYKKLRG